MHRPRPSHQIGCLLTIKPYELEQAFWRSHETRRILLITDTVACVLAFLVAFLSLYRIGATMPERSPFSIYMGPTNILFNLGALGVVYHVSVALPVLAMILRPAFYYKHRYALFLGNRLLRLIISTSHLMFAQGVENLYRAVSTRTLAETPAKALLVHVLHPVAFWMAQSLFILPWRWACLAQLINTVAVTAYYSARLPCLMETVLLKPNKLLKAQFQNEAVRACELLQASASVTQMAIGDLTFMLARDVCVGLKAVQILQLCATLVCLLILPLWFMYTMERLLKRRFLEALQLPDYMAADTAAASSNSTAGAAVQQRRSTPVEHGSSSFRAMAESTGTLRHRRHVTMSPALNSHNMCNATSCAAGATAVASNSVGASFSSRINDEYSNASTVAAGTSQEAQDTRNIPESALVQHLACVVMLLPVTWLLCEFLVSEVFDAKCPQSSKV